MRVVHHARYVHYLELARIEYLDRHDRPYREYVAEGLHFAVTGLEVRYQQAARFDDRLQVTCWLAWLKRVSLAIGYVVLRDGELIVSATTEHALVSDAGKLVAIPPARRSSRPRWRLADEAEIIRNEARGDQPPVFRDRGH
jgi:acyl-CoA thioester hydrolase